MNLRHYPLASALAVIVESPRLESSNADDFKQEALALVEAGHADLVFDLSRVEFMDSRGLGCLIALLKAVSPAGSVALTGLTRHVHDLFRLTRLDRVFPIYRDLDHAAEAKPK
jgi:anti-sigma B factor antagonist